MTAGPGQYDADRADTITKPKMANINMGTSPSRPKNLTKSGEFDVAPGQYDDGVRFNSNVKSFKIGEKRQEKVEMTAGPGQYDAERASSVTKSRTRAAIITNEKARPDTFAN